MKTFEIISGNIVASDPCYVLETNPTCMGVIDNVKKGTWEISIEEEFFGNRIAVFNINHIDRRANGQPFTFPFSACVDSGQFGFFDKDFFRNDKIAENLPKSDFGDDYDNQEGDSWYRAVCEITLGEDGYGVVPSGAVSSSGYGDGSYDVVGFKDSSGEWVAFSVTFIGDDEDEDYYDDEDTDNEDDY
jgi:hypothetical protein